MGIEGFDARWRLGGKSARRIAQGLLPLAQMGLGGRGQGEGEGGQQFAVTGGLLDGGVENRDAFGVLPGSSQGGGKVLARGGQVGIPPEGHPVVGNGGVEIASQQMGVADPL